MHSTVELFTFLHSLHHRSLSMMWLLELLGLREQIIKIY